MERIIYCTSCKSIENNIKYSNTHTCTSSITLITIVNINEVTLKHFSYMYTCILKPSITLILFNKRDIERVYKIKLGIQKNLNAKVF